MASQIRQRVLSNVFFSLVLGWLIVGMILVVVVHGQIEPKPQALKLSEKAEHVLSALRSIELLPADEWRIHVGDLAHGESAALDDSSWPSIKGRYKAPADAAWFRRTIVVPPQLNGYDLTGTRVSFEFDISANGSVPLIIYFDGRRVAMGEDLEPIPLFDHAKPGDRVVVAVKALNTIDVKQFIRAELKISFSDERPSPSDFRLEATAAQYLVPALLPDPTQQAQLLDKAIAAVDINALQAGQQKAFDLSLQEAHQQLEGLRPTLALGNFHLTGNAHIDAAWLWPWTETVDVVKRTFSTALQLMREYPAYTYTQSAAAYSEWMAEKYPDMHKEIQARVKEGRWEMVGGMWVEPDLNMPDGESLVRQLLVGKGYFKNQFGSNVRIGWNPDSFGYNWQLPQIYKKSGMDYFVTQKMAWNDTNKLPFKLFYWQSPDGSRVLTYFPHDYGNPIEPDQLAQDFNVSRKENPGLPEMMHLYGVGDHGGGPTRLMLDTADHWMQKKMVFPHASYGVAQSYFSSIESKLDSTHAPVWNYSTLAAGKGILPEPPEGKVSIPVWNDELYFEYHRGVFTTQARHKRNMRESEEWLLNAEKWSAFSWLSGSHYPATQLNEAWKKVLFNQFHDLAAGSGIGVIYKEAQRDYDMVRFTAAEAQDGALRNISSQIETSKGVPLNGVPILVWNPLAWSRTDVVSAQVLLPKGNATLQILDEKGNVLPAQPKAGDSSTTATISFLAKDVPALGYRLFYARNATTPKVVTPGAQAGAGVTASQSENTLENEFLKVAVDPGTGCITHLIDKKTRFDAIAAGGCGNQLQTFKDLPTQYDAWNIDPGTLDHFTPIEKADSVTLVDHGPLHASIRVVHTWQSSKFVQDIIVYAGLNRVDVVNTIDWHEQHVLLKAAFPLAASGPMATYEIPYGTIQRPTTRNNSWEAAKFEVPALRWADLGDGQHGFSLLNESKYGYDAKDNVLRLTLLRSATWPDPVADQGEQKFTYSLYPHAAGWQQALTVRRGYEFNYKLEAQQVEAHTGVMPAQFSFGKVEPENLVLTAAKTTEEGDGLLLRFYEWAGKSGSATITLPPGVTGASATNLMEQPEGSALAVTANTVTVPFTPYGITTVKVLYADRGPKFWATAARVSK